MDIHTITILINFKTHLLLVYQVINSYRDNAEAYSDERKTKLLASVQCEHTDQGELSRV